MNRAGRSCRSALIFGRRSSAVLPGSRVQGAKEVRGVLSLRGTSGQRRLILALPLAIGLASAALSKAEPIAAVKEDAAPASQPAAPRAPSSGLLQFLDGSSLHGQLQFMNPDQGVAWQHPDVKRLLEFKPTYLSWIKFEQAKPVATVSPPANRFRFQNGDEIFGRLVSLEAESFELESWLGGTLKGERRTLQSILVLAKGFLTLYEGPAGLEGWNVGKTPKGWEYRESTFIANGPGILGRDFGLTGSSIVSFDLAWNGQFSLILSLYTRVFDRFDYGSGSYIFHLGPGYAALQRVQSGGGGNVLGQVQIPPMLNKRKVRLEIRTNKEEASLALLADGLLIQRWKDNVGFAAKGSGLAFFVQMDGPPLKLSNLKISEWDGKFEPDGVVNGRATEDLVCLANRDKVTGKLQSVRQGKLSFTTPQTTLEIPLERVTQMVFRQAAAAARNRDPWETRAYFSGGGSVAFQVEKWDPGQVLGNSPNFGRLTFHPQSVRQVEFNLGQRKETEEEPGFPGDENWDVQE